ncbi:hypothetical protein ASF84_09495 [Pseudomonas sp. Leaf127]|nr:hypothetical protein ASF84_09495 [Pseudomonas sp. Leaf127]
MIQLLCDFAQNVCGYVIGRAFTINEQRNQGTAGKLCGVDHPHCAAFATTIRIPAYFSATIRSRNDSTRLWIVCQKRHKETSFFFGPIV